MDRTTIKLGHKYRDTVTGFEGIATGTSTTMSEEYTSVKLEGKAGSDGKLREHWFSVTRLELLEA